MKLPPAALLLDTHAAIWLMEGGLESSTVELIGSAGAAGGVFVSPVSAWEIGLLTRPRADAPPKLALEPDPQSWFAALMAKPIIRTAHLTARIALEASNLPGSLHQDPADRLLIATARELALPLVTRDRKIIDYGLQGFLSVIPC